MEFIVGLALGLIIGTIYGGAAIWSSHKKHIGEGKVPYLDANDSIAWRENE